MGIILVAAIYFLQKEPKETGFGSANREILNITESDN